MCVCVYMCVNVCSCVFVGECMRVCMYVGVYVFMYVCNVCCQASPGLLLLKHMALPSVPSSSANCLPATQVAACRLPASEVTTPPSQVFAVAQEAHGSLTSGSHSEPPPDLHACMITTSHGSTYHAALTVKPTPLPSALHALPYKMPAKGISPHTILDAHLRRTLAWDFHLGTCSCPTPCFMCFIHHSTTHVHASACLMCFMLSCRTPCLCSLPSLSLASPQTILCSSNFMLRHAATRFSGAHCSAGRVHWPTRQPAWQC